MKRGKTLLLLLLWTAVIAGVLYAGQLDNRENTGQVRDSGTGGASAAAAREAGAEKNAAALTGQDGPRMDEAGAAEEAAAGGTTEISAAAGDGSGIVAADPSFAPGDFLWQGGMPACDAATATIFIPCGEGFSAEDKSPEAAETAEPSAENLSAESRDKNPEAGKTAEPSAENLSAESRDKSPEAGKTAGSSAEGGSGEGPEAAVDEAFREALLQDLVPADPKSRIVLLPEEWTGSIADAVRQGHAFAARLESASETVDFNIVLTGLPALCIRKTDSREIERKEEHDGQIRLLPLWPEEGRKDALEKSGPALPAGLSLFDREEGAAEMTGTAAGRENALENVTENVSVSDIRTLRCSFHVRGNVSSLLAKKPYKISILDKKGQKEDARWLDLRSDDDWILNPLYTDSTRVREMTAYQLWEETAAFADVPVGTARMRYVELFLDDGYQGIYGLTEPVDRKQLGLSEGDLLYKIDRWDREYPYRDLYDDAEAAGELEIDNDAGLSCVELRYPRTWDSTATWRPMQAFHAFSFATFDPDTLAAEGLAPDMDSIVNLSLFCAMTHAEDNTWKNSFLIARRRTSADGAPEEIRYDLYRTIWDLNYVFGDCFLYVPEDRYTAFYPETAEAVTEGTDSTFDLEAFRKADPAAEEMLREALRRKWAAWRAGGIGADAVIAAAQRNMGLLEQSGALAREMDRWPQKQDCGEAAREMETWIRRRFEYLDQYFREP